MLKQSVIDIIKRYLDALICDEHGAALDGGASMHALERARATYPISLHGVGLSLGSADALAQPHLAKLKRLVDAGLAELDAKPPAAAQRALLLLAQLLGAAGALQPSR